MGEGIAIDSAAYQDFEAFRGDRHRDSFLKNWNDPVLAAGVFGVVLVHGRNGVADESRIVVKPLLHHHVRLRLGQPERVLDGIASSRDRILQALASINVTTRLTPKTMGFVNQRL